MKLRLQTKIKISSGKVGLKLSQPVKTKLIKILHKICKVYGEVEGKRTNTS